MNKVNKKKVKLAKTITDFANKESMKFLKAFEKEKELKKLERQPSFARKLADKVTKKQTKKDKIDVPVPEKSEVKTKMVYTIGDQLLAEGINRAIQDNPNLRDDPNKLHVEQTSIILKDMHRDAIESIDEHLNRKAIEAKPVRVVNEKLNDVRHVY